MMNSLPSAEKYPYLSRAIEASDAGMSAPTFYNDVSSKLKGRPRQEVLHAAHKL